MKTWEHLADKLFTICKWDASCLYRISFRTSVGFYVWTFLIRKIINWTVRGWWFVNIATGCLCRKMQAHIENATLSINNDRIHSLLSKKKIVISLELNWSESGSRLRMSLHKMILINQLIVFCTNYQFFALSNVLIQSPSRGGWVG